MSKTIKSQEARDTAQALLLHLTHKGEHVDLQEELRDLLDRMDSVEPGIDVQVSDDHFGFIKKTTRTNKKSAYSKWF